MRAISRNDAATLECLRLGTDQIVVHATSAQAGGALFAVEILMPSGGGPPVMHRHDPGEVYFVLHGEFAFYTEDPDGSVRRWTAGAGAVVPLAGRTPHTIRNESGADAAAFVVYAPGAPMEGFHARRSGARPPTATRGWTPSWPSPRSTASNYSAPYQPAGAGHDRTGNLYVNPVTLARAAHPSTRRL